MKYFRLGKLVRDLIIDQIESDKRITFGVKKLNSTEFQKELLLKLHEETEELQEAKSKTEMIKEIADVQEVIDYLKESLSITEDEIKESQEKKIKAVGGFEKKLYIDVVGIEEDNEWYDRYVSNPRAVEVDKPK